MKHLKLFETEAAFEASKDNIEEPWVALVSDNVAYSSEYTIPNETTITFYINDTYDGTIIECHAEENMNWIDWKNSNYFNGLLNIDQSNDEVGAINKRGFKRAQLFGTQEDDTNTRVYPIDSIINNKTYFIIYANSTGEPA